jgi:hypothetical protein
MRWFAADCNSLQNRKKQTQNPPTLAVMGFDPLLAPTKQRVVIASRCESELQLTVRESRSRGSGAPLDVPESSRLATTLFPVA